MTGLPLQGTALAYRQALVAPYQRLVSPSVKPIADSCLREAYRDPSQSPWCISDWATLSLLATTTLTCRPRRLLQLGTHIGYTALILADMIRQGGPGGRLITVEPVAEWHEVARRRMTEAGLDRVVTFLDGYSTSPEVMEAMVGHGPYDLVYVDSSHSRDDTLIELDFLWGQITPGAWIFLHDTSPFSDQWDSAGKGGVRAAIRVWLRDHAEECLYFSCEPPLWPTPYGLGVLRRQIADGS